MSWVLSAITERLVCSMLWHNIVWCSSIVPCTRRIPITVRLQSVFSQVYSEELIRMKEGKMITRSNNYGASWAKKITVLHEDNVFPFCHVLLQVMKMCRSAAGLGGELQEKITQVRTGRGGGAVFNSSKIQWKSISLIKLIKKKTELPDWKELFS